MARRRARTPTPTPLPAWSNQKLRLYHGTLKTYADAIMKSGINLARCHARTDFGRGIYTTTVLRQAFVWACQLSERKPRSSPAVLVFEVDRDALAQLESIWFVRGQPDATDYWNLVVHCRSGKASHARPIGSGWYDLVIGPVTSKWAFREAFPDMDQISFHTDRAVNLLEKANPGISP